MLRIPGTSPGVYAATNYVTNPGFEANGQAVANPQGWTTWGDTSASYTQTGGHTGNYRLTHWAASAYTVNTYQTITGLPDGIYTLTAWVESGGGQTQDWVSAKNYGGQEMAAPLPTTSTWQQISVSGIDVTNGQLTVNFWTVGNAGNWSSIDDVSLIQGSAATYVKGVDASWLPAMESSGYKFKNLQGVNEDAVSIFQQLGVKAMRIRLFVNPSTNVYSGWCSEADDIALAKRAAAAGMKILLDFEYSDTWADPGHQTMPAAWSNDTTINELGTQVYNYTYQVMKDFQANGVTPTWVQTGNEINNGLLWPLGNTANGFSNIAWIINSGYNAVKAVSPSTQVIVHLANGWDTSDFEWFFNGLKAAGGHWDIVGMSLYPLDSNYQTYASEAETTMKDMQSLFGTPSMVVEAGIDAADPTDGTYFMQLLSQDTQAAGGLGIFYWEPESYNWNGYTNDAWYASTQEPMPFMWSY